MCWAKSLRIWANEHGIDHRKFSVEELLELRRQNRSVKSGGYRTLKRKFEVIGGKK